MDQRAEEWQCQAQLVEAWQPALQVFHTSSTLCVSYFGGFEKCTPSFLYCAECSPLHCLYFVLPLPLYLLCFAASISPVWLCGRRRCDTSPSTYIPKLCSATFGRLTCSGQTMGGPPGGQMMGAPPGGVLMGGTFRLLCALLTSTRPARRSNDDQRSRRNDERTNDRRTTHWWHGANQWPSL